MIDTSKQKAQEEFMKLYDDVIAAANGGPAVDPKRLKVTLHCNSRWMSSQRVYCQLEAGHPGMCYSTATNDEGEDCELWWMNEDLPVLEGDTNETSKDG